MKRVLAVAGGLLMGFAAVAIASPNAAFDAITGVTGSFSGQLKSNSANALTSTTTYWTATGPMFVQSQAATVSRFKTGAASTLTGLTAAFYAPFSNGGTGTATVKVTDTSGTALCTVTHTCNTSTVQDVVACSAALAANTEYQVRHVGCSTGVPALFYNVTATVTTP